MVRTGKAMFRAFLAQLASGGFGAGLRALLFLFFFDKTHPEHCDAERIPAPEDQSAIPEAGRLTGRIAAGQAGVNNATRFFFETSDDSNATDSARLQM
jgi:hypothetical protein